MNIEFQLNNRQLQVNAPPHMRLSALLGQTGDMFSGHTSCANNSCGRCLVIIDDQLMYSCLLTAFEVRNSVIKTAQYWNATEIFKQFYWALAFMHPPLCIDCQEARFLSFAYFFDRNQTNAQAMRECLSLVHCRCTSYQRLEQIFLFICKLRDRHAK